MPSVLIGEPHSYSDTPWDPELRLGAPFKIEGKTTDAAGRPVADATVSLVWAQFKQWNPTAFNATTTLKTAMREKLTSDWADTNNLIIRIRPWVEVAGRVRAENGQPPDEPLEIDASYAERKGVFSLDDIMSCLATGADARSAFTQ